MLRLIFTFYLILATIAGPHVCCMTARAASLLPDLPVSKAEQHPCCPEDAKDEAVPPPSPQLPCESPTILFKIERHDVPSVSVTMPLLFIAELPLASVTPSDLLLWTPTHLFGTDLLHTFQRLTC